VELWRKPQIDRQLCNRCGRCVTVCPVGAVTWLKGLPAIIRAPDCVYCGVCEDQCPTGAVSLVFDIVLEPSE